MQAISSQQQADALHCRGMGKRYDQYCPIAHALELVGERWALLVVRELMHGPKRYTDLADSLGIGTNILAARLRDLEACGVVDEAEAAAPGRLPRLRAHRLRPRAEGGHAGAGALGRSVPRPPHRRARAVPRLARERPRLGARPDRAARQVRVPRRGRGRLHRRRPGPARAGRRSPTSSWKATRWASTTCSWIGRRTSCPSAGDHELLGRLLDVRPRPVEEPVGT